MKQIIYGVAGYKGKLGSLLVRRPNFVPIDCDITNLTSVQKSYQDVDVLVNCAAVSSIDECERDSRFAFRVNVRGADNLMQVYGNRVLNISSDHVFGGWTFLPPTEKSKPNPINVYGTTKMIMEDLAVNTYRAKVIRISRTISLQDPDISTYINKIYYGEITPVPNFFYRNYLTQNQAVDGIEYFVHNFSTLPNILHYGSNKPTSFFSLMDKITYNSYLLREKAEYSDKLSPRPKKAGFSVRLAKKLGFPIYDLEDVVQDFWK